MSLAFQAVGGSISASQSNTNIDLKFVSAVILINDGTDSVFIRLSQSPGTLFPNAVTTDFELKNGESVSYESRSGYRFSQVSVICNTGETATVRYSGIY